jgi:hypothetical protein
MRRRPEPRRTPDQPCLNCGDPTPGNYCPNCGQAKRSATVSVATLVMDVLEDQLIVNRALPRTLGYLITHPGLLTTEYINGRIVRYIAPFRLYLASSVVFFLLLSFFGLRALDQAQIRVGSEGEAAADSVRAALRREGLRISIDTSDLAELGASNQTTPRPEARIDSTAQAPDTVTAPTGGLQPWAITLSRQTWESGWGGKVKQRIIERYGHLPGREAIREGAQNYLEYVPHMVFLLLPVFAFVLKLLYIRRRRYYAEHFVFALHVHAFTFFMFILMFIIRQSLVNWLLFGWVMIYIWLAMKRVYGQGWFRTTAKYLVLGFVYFNLLAIALTMTLLGSLMLA